MQTTFDVSTFDMNKFTVNDIKAIAAQSGYYDLRLVDVKFSNVSPTGAAVFDIEFYDLEDELDTGKVYVSFNNAGKLELEF